MSIVTIGPSGGDDTSALQSAINATAQAGNQLQLLTGTFHSSALNFPSNSNLLLSAGVTVSMVSGNPHFLNLNATNITIAGAGPTSSIFDMHRSGADCFRVQNASNVNISGVAGNNAGEDGLYVTSVVDLHVSNCIFNNCTRQGSSITSLVKNLFYNNCTFSNTNGAGPSAGIDIEPNPQSGGTGAGNYLTNINITDCISSGNQGAGLDFSLQNLDGTSLPVSIHVLRHTNTNNGGLSGFGYAGFLANNNGSTNPSGYVLIENCTTTNDAWFGVEAKFWLANGPALIFKNLTVTNPHQNGPDPQYHNSAAVAVSGGGGNVGPNGNVHFINCSVNCTNGKTDHYFDFFDQTSVGSSQGGPRNVQFIPGTLSGATVGTVTTPGKWNGSASGPIH